MQKLRLYMSAVSTIFTSPMTLAIFDLSIWISLVTIALVVVCALMCLLILMQRPKQEGLGAAFGSGMADAAWGARTTDILQKGTVYLGTLFFVFSLLLSILVGKKNAQDGQRTKSSDTPAKEAPAEEIIEEPEIKAPVDETEAFKKQLEEVAETVPEAPKPAETPVPDTPAETPAE
jgi:preprotein translocase subunit SecG